MLKKFIVFIENLQNVITQRIEELEEKVHFEEELWKRPGGGGGRTRVIENGTIFEKGGVNTSHVHGELPLSMQEKLGVSEARFAACGLSLVLHPKNPFVPTVHANWRYFEVYDDEGNVVDQWFGGGQDLTPYYFFEEDAVHFHRVCKAACDHHDQAFYRRYKKHCDSYFYNQHRQESRGIGGLFFDYLRPTKERTIENWYDFVTEVGDCFTDAYFPIVERRMNNAYSAPQRRWQEIRRGRYVEFNLVYDRGTLFGLKTNGRIESILMSLPPVVQWPYDFHPQKGSPEAELIEVLQHPKDWLTGESSKN